MATATTWRGGEQQILYLLSGLSARHHPVHLVSPPGPLADRAQSGGIPVTPITARGDLDWAAARKLRGVLHRERPAVLHLHTGRAHALGRLATLGRRSRPAVVVSRRVDFPIKGGLAGRIKYGSGVDRYLCVSDRIGEVLREGGVSAERVVTVYSGVDESRFEVPSDPIGLRRELAIPQTDKLVGFVGALVGHKAPGDLVAALAHLPSEVHALFAGEGPLGESLRSVAKDLQVSARVHWLGHRQDVPRILRSVDAFCLPSHLEGLGTSVLDAMAAGAPVVATRAGGIPEMVESGQSGLLVPPGEPRELARALSRVLQEPGLAERLRAGGRRRVQEFSADRMVERTLEVYQKLAPTAGEGGRQA